MSYLQANAAPGFVFYCVSGHPTARGRAADAWTCAQRQIGFCPDNQSEIILGLDGTCPATYENEAFNSRHADSSAYGFDAPIDPYGGCGD